MYAVEASNMASHCKKLVKMNGYADRMVVIAGKIEEVCVCVCVHVCVTVCVYMYCMCECVCCVMM